MLEACEDRTTPTPVITVAALTHANEGDTAPQVVARLTRTDTSGTLFVNYSLSGTATGGGTDYYSMGSSIAFMDGQSTVDLSMLVVNDSASEPTETVIVTLTSGTGYTVGTPASATINIYDNDAPYVYVGVEDAGEDGDPGLIGFFRIGDLSASLTANFTVGGTATSGTDYTSIGTTVTFSAGSNYAGKVITALADNQVEGTETISATVTSGTGYSVGSPATGTLSLHDDPPVVQVSATNTAEGGGASSFTFTRTGGKPSEALTVYYAVAGSATEGDDYSALSGSITFAANSSTATVTLTAVNDSIVESDESVVVFILEDDGYTIGQNEDASAIIHDNDTAIVSVEKNYDALEGGFIGSFWFTRIGDLSGSLTVNFSVSGSATPGTDFTSIGTSVTFAANESVAVVEIDAADESSSDPNESVIITIASGTGYTIGDDDAATLTIIDAATPFVTVEKIDDGIEGGTNGKFRFTRTGSTSGTLTVYYTVGGDAESGEDYTALTGSVTIAASASTADVTVTVTNDSDDEPRELVALAITANSNYAIGDEGSAVVAIDDNDLPEVTVTKIVNAAETGGYGIFRFVRTLGEVAWPLDVSYSVGGTATPGTDYTSLSGTFTFAAHEATKDVVVTPNTDSTTEGTETVTVTISSDSDYSVGTPSSASMDIREEVAGGISGKMWKDTDGDGVIDGGETGLAYRPVFLMKGDEIVATTQTNATGDYSFTGVLADTYVVSFVIPGDYEATTSDDGTESASVTAGTTTTDVDTGCQPPASFTPTGKRDGIDWSTFDASSAIEWVGPNDVKGYLYTVKTVNSSPIKVFAVHPLNKQPQAVQEKQNQGKWQIGYNCYGYAMNMTEVVFEDGSKGNFSIISASSAYKVLTTQYASANARVNAS